MCRRRRVYYSCLHEDHDVTPPRSLLYCPDAKPTEGSSSNSNSDSDDSSLKPCAAIETLPLTSKLDLLGGVVRSGPCEACAADTGQHGMPPHNRTIEESASSNGNTAIQDNAPKDTMEPQEEDDVFVFDWDVEDDGLLSDPRGSTRESARKSRVSGLANGAKATVKGSASNGIEHDFQLYDGDDEFADELKEISSKES
ncbi:hypothetical protein F4776DRAFT_638819 [Hypoxylon sp. NC0597]|nr:hypothetical protein F4776DRAFT_638819 [Hypoxylon sp. NC0597]